MLWPALVTEWGLSQEEARSVDRREGQYCPQCLVRLRSASLAKAITSTSAEPQPLERWVQHQPQLAVLEINRAGQLTPWLERLPGHRLVEHPDIDLHDLPYPDESWDLVVHSDTLEHVDHPVRALEECRRVLRRGGRLCFTIPVVSGRLTRRRDGLRPSYHGLESDPVYLVVTEYGADFWCQPLAAGFARLELTSLQWPDAFALTAWRD